MSRIFCAALAATFVSSATALAGALPTVPFTEDFATDNSGWRDAFTGVPTWNASGGPDGSSFISTTFNFANSAAGDTPVLFRGQDEFGSSGGAFEGDWITGNVQEFSVFVRHGASAPVNFFTRFASAFNFPGAVAVDFTPVSPGVWTEISFAIDPANPAFVTFEGSDFNTVFSSIGHVQVGVSVPSGLAGVDSEFSFSIDQPSIVPGPGALAMVGVGGLGALGRRRRG